MVVFEKGKSVNPNDTLNYQTNGIVSMEILHNNQGSITLFAFGKGQQLSPHSAPLDALLQVTEGEMKITVDDIEHTVKAGEIFMIPSGHVHSVKAEQDFKMMITMIKSDK